MNIGNHYLHRQILFTCIPDCTATSSKFVDKMSVAEKKNYKVSARVYLRSEVNVFGRLILVGYVVLYSH